jgi:RNA polymerase sigma-70 factor (ECF subfamily)
MDLNEEIAWKEIRQKDMKAFENYYKENYKRFLLMACKYLKDSSLAEEIVNDVFMKIWEESHRLEIESSLTAYIYRSIINKSINTLKKLRKENNIPTDLSFFPDEGYERYQIEENELKIKIYEAICHLPAQCRKVFEMSRFEKMKQQEIANKLGISVKTVKNHITIALKQLHKLLLVSL